MRQPGLLILRRLQGQIHVNTTAIKGGDPQNNTSIAAGYPG